jgi:hypothetical protein
VQDSCAWQACHRCKTNTPGLVVHASSQGSDAAASNATVCQLHCWGSQAHINLYTLPTIERKTVLRCESISIGMAQLWIHEVVV